MHRIWTMPGAYGPHFWKLLQLVMAIAMLECTMPDILKSIEHTAVYGEAAGGIFSYTIEGATVHHMYTSTAFVYGSSYVLEVYNGLQELHK